MKVGKDLQEHQVQLSTQHLSQKDGIIGVVSCCLYTVQLPEIHC